VVTQEARRRDEHEARGEKEKCKACLKKGMRRRRKKRRRSCV